MANLTDNDLNRIRGLLSFFIVFLFSIFLGSSISYAISLIVYNISNAAVNSKEFVFINTNLPFVGMALGIFFSLKYLLNVSLKSLITIHAKFNKRYFVIPFVISIIYLTLYMIIANKIGYKEVLFNQAPMTDRIILGLLVLLITPLQSALEELLFRAILLKGLVGKYSMKNRTLAIAASVICGLVFVAFHLKNPEMSTYKLYAFIYYFSFAFASALLTLYFGTVEISIALHVANNLFVALICNYQDSALQTVSLFNEVGSNIHYIDLAVTALILITTFYALNKYTYSKNGKNGITES